MELKFEELENQNEIENQNQNQNENYVNYWSNANQTTTNQKKSKISYDDILSSLNMVVSNGVLQFAKPIPQNQEQNAPKKQVTIKEPSNQKNQINQKNHINQKNQKNQINQINQQNNYITNKYFKDYQEEETINNVPMTKEEYKKKLIQDYINRQQAQRRISQIKSKKLLFDTRNINIAPIQMPRDMNKLFSTFKKS